jgi:alpha-tubulin suppressor-like RCC1 family protein
MHYDCGHDDYFDAAPEPGEYLASHWNVGSTLNRFIAFGTKPSTVWGWGLNQNGELGSGSATSTTSPVQTQGISSVKQVASGAYHSLAVKNDGTVWTWGYNNVGQLGINSLSERFTPTQVPGLTGVVAVAGGFAHSLAVKSDGTVWAWGWNLFGQLGDGTTTNRQLPVQVPGLTGATAVTGGVGHSLALRSDGTVRSWGLNKSGQLGDGSAVEINAVPVVVSGLSGVKSVSAGGYHNLAVRTDGTLRAWGLNQTGQLGTGLASPNRSVPVAVPGISGVAEAAGGFAHSLVRKSDGTVWGWGWNAMGQLGIGTLLDVWAPRQVGGASGAVGLAAGIYHSLVLLSNKTVQGFGWGGFGQLGTVLNRLLPGIVVTGHGVTGVAAGLGHSLQLVG